MAITIALSYVLGLFDIFKLPQGGGVSLESIPLMIFAFIEGPLYGFFAGFIYGLSLISKPSAFLHPIQFFLDYPLAFSSFFIIGFTSLKPNSFETFLYAMLSFCFRFFFHMLSGIIFCSLFMPNLSENIWKYVAIYNASYLLPTSFICIGLYLPISKKLKFLLSGKGGE